jgi:sulfur relay (sulfurtransferase) complex TusBCD TusD component (DsrE family)
MAKRILITADSLGRSDGDLGRVLMRNFLTALAQYEDAPSAVMLANEGVRLACDGSDALQALQQLAAAGVAVRTCSTCLTHLGLTAALRVGEAGSMPDLVAAICGPDEIVTIT